MSKLAALDQLLEQYQQLSYHTDPILKNRLHEAQTWLKNRIQMTHQDLFNQKENVLMAQYFLNRLYGGPEFDDLAVQIERLLKYAHKAEKIIPENAIKTGLKSVGLAVLAMQLDEQVAAQLLKDYPADQVIDNEMMRQTLIKLDQYDARLDQLSLLDDLGGALDKYMRSFIMHTAFKMCKGAANKYRFELMYDFIGEGFIAMKPMKSAANFIHTFTVKEREIVEKVHAGEPNPFY
ncbi:FFLEELY motif protein [Acinetobacter sp. TY1]|uniref:FFLEELY motif protein n=1 Tax=unclassified Acinetobacter TaxID=196816 RepID=UPI003AF48D2E